MLCFRFSVSLPGNEGAGLANERLEGKRVDTEIVKR